MFRLLDKLATSVLEQFHRHLIPEPSIDDSDFDWLSSGILQYGNEEALDRLDAKAGSLLTHISMMVAAATFMISAIDTSPLEKIIISVEIIAYLYLALLCICCLKFIDIPPTTPAVKVSKRMRTELRLEVRRRSLLLNIAIRWMFLITFVFMLTVVAHIFL